MKYLRLKSLLCFVGDADSALVKPPGDGLHPPACTLIKTCDGCPDQTMSRPQPQLDRQSRSPSLPTGSVRDRRQSWSIVCEPAGLGNRDETARVVFERAYR